MTQHFRRIAVMSERKNDPSGAMDAYNRLRNAVLSGEIAPSSRLSQVKLAEHLGLSRTPVREALRMMEKEGLVRAERGRQVVIAPTSMSDLDELYALRINLDSATARMTVPLLSDADFQEMRQCQEAMTLRSGLDVFEAFDQAHRQFHLIVIRSAGPRHVTHSTQLNEHAERYRRLYLAQPSSWEQSREEHQEILLGCERRDGDLVAHLLAEHFARIALTIVARIEPSFEPTLVRAALRGALQVPGAGIGMTKERAEQKRREAKNGVQV